MMDFLPEILPGIGTMAIGLKNYWGQFTEMKETVLRAHDSVLSLFAEKGELVSAGLVDDADSAQKAGELFQQKRIDILFVHITTYANAETLLPAVRNLDVPVVLLNIQAVEALALENVKSIGDWLGTGVTPAALSEMSNCLIRLGKPFDTVTGHLEKDPILQRELDLWCRIALLLHRLKTQKIGLLGRPFAGMMDLNLDETKLFSRFGTFVQHVEWDDVVHEIENASPSERALCSNVVQSVFPGSDSALSSDERQRIADVLAGMKVFAQNRNLCGIASHYEGSTRPSHDMLLAAANPVFSILNLHGISCSVEGDVKVAIAMLILKTIAGSANLAELYSMDFINDVIFIGHSGAGDPAIARQPARLFATDTFHGKTGKGYVVQFYPDPGDVTLLALTQNAAGDFQLVAAEGKIVEGPVLELGDTNCRVQFPQGLRKFVRDWSAHGPTHHGVLGHGHHIESLQRVAIALNLPLFTV